MKSNKQEPQGDLLDYVLNGCIVLIYNDDKDY